MNTQQSRIGDAGPQRKVDELAIETLAKETHAGVDVVRELYETEHARLASQARIKTYISVFATRIVRNTLQETPHPLQ